MNLSGKNYLVTGGSRGIGEAIAKELLSLGARVTITATTQRAGWWDEQDFCRLFPSDFSKENDILSLVNFIQQNKIDGLVNNAGIFINDEYEANDFTQWKELQLINVELPMRLITAAAKKMAVSGGGRIVNIGSIAAVITRPGIAAYSASKAALSSITRTTALQYAEGNVLINCVAPAYTDTDMLKTLDKSMREQLMAKIPLSKFGKPEDVAKLTLFLLSENNQFITGQTIIVDGGVTIQ